jgi:poly-gamma-glutamate system protein
MSPARRVLRGARRRWLGAGIVSVIAWVLLETLAPGRDIAWTPAMRSAARTMGHVLEVVAGHCREAGIAVNDLADPNGTCLIGPEISELFTTTGQLEAKRTTTNPDVAGVIAHMLQQAGVSAGDTVAVAASGSFPALMVATLAAVESLEAVPITILSAGASSWGATRPEFDLLDLHRLLRERGVLRAPITAASLGGSHDVGREFEPEVRDRLARKLAERGIRFLDEPDLAANVAARMRIYGHPVAFVNIGGSDVSLGTSPEILKVPAGLSLELADGVVLPPPAQRGLVFAMAAAHVPVIHLLHVRGLVLRFGLSWDPIPLPRAGTTRLREEGRAGSVAFWLIAAGWLAGLGVAAFARRGGTSGIRPVHSSG